MSDNKENKEFNNKPVVESSVSKSKDGQWIIHKTVITTIKHKNYYEAVLKDEGGDSQ